MYRLGEKQILTVRKKVDFGVYLSEKEPEADEDTVLLPIKQVPEHLETGDDIEVFLYRDSEDRLIATVKEPKLTLGQVAVLQVVQVNRVGAFLNWGLEKDLFLPYREQTAPVKVGDDCVVALYIDKSRRLCATMKVYPYLRQDSPYQKDDRVKGIIYEISDNFGAFVAVDACFSGLIPKKEMTRSLAVGEHIEARITGVRKDGKLGLSLRDKAYIQMYADAEKVMEKIRKEDGELPFTDKADPELIRREMGMSKNEFKRAVGHLLKENKIVITNHSILMK